MPAGITKLSVTADITHKKYKPLNFSKEIWKFGITRKRKEKEKRYQHNSQRLGFKKESSIIYAPDYS